MTNEEYLSGLSDAELGALSKAFQRLSPLLRSMVPALSLLRGVDVDAEMSRRAREAAVAQYALRAKVKE